jgi:hypothetical protein
MSEKAKRLLAAGVATITLVAAPATILAVGGASAGDLLACGSNNSGGCAG